MKKPIVVIDADFRYQDGPIQLIKVWHESFGQPLQLDDICGHDFWLRWMPNYVQVKYGSLMNYWDATHPLLRDEHVAAYLLERTAITEQDLQYA